METGHCGNVSKCCRTQGNIHLEESTYLHGWLDVYCSHQKVMFMCTGKHVYITWTIPNLAHYALSKSSAQEHIEVTRSTKRHGVTWIKSNRHSAGIDLIIFGIGFGIYLGCFLPGGYSAHNTIITQIMELTSKHNTLKKGGDGVYSWSNYKGINS